MKDWIAMIARQNDIDPEKVFEQIYSFSEKLSASEKNGAERDEFVREVGNEFDRRGISLRHRTTVGNAINQMVYPKDDTLKGVLILLAHSLNQLTDQSRRPFDADLLLNAFHAFNSDWDFKKWKRGPTLETSAPRKKINRTIEVLEGLSIRLRYGATAHREARAEPMMARVGGDGRLFTLTAVTGEPGMTRARVFEGIGFLRGGVLSLIEAGEHSRHGVIIRQLSVDIESDEVANEKARWGVLTRPDQTGHLASQLSLLLTKRDWRLDESLPVREGLLSQLRILNADQEFKSWAETTLGQAFKEGEPTLNAPAAGKLEGAVGHLPKIASLDNPRSSSIGGTAAQRVS